MKKLLIFLLTLLPMLAAAQQKILFTFSANGEPLELNSMRYTSSAGIRYEVCQVQYFISNLKIHSGLHCTSVPNSIHYVDIEIPSTHQFSFVADPGLLGADSLSFTFGLDSIQNRSYRFRNPPQNLMFWPDYLGGGYHYMKTNIRYIAPDSSINAFNCHLGRGQVYDTTGEPVSYIENHFEVKIPITRDASGNVVINLDVARIFDYPNKANFSDYRGIMNNQEAMRLFCENLRWAFR